MADNVTTAVRLPTWVIEARDSSSKFFSELYASGSKRAGEAYSAASGYASQAKTEASKHLKVVADKVSLFWKETAQPNLAWALTQLRTGYGVAGVLALVGIIALKNALDRRENNHCVKVSLTIFAVGCFAAAGYAASFKAVPLI